MRDLEPKARFENTPMRKEEVIFCPRCATRLEEKIHAGHVRPACPACGWVFYEDPKVAAAVLIEDTAGRVLLVRRANEPQRGKWTLPAGFINGSEAPDLAAARECLEETGLEVVITQLLDIYAQREHARGADFVIFYRANVKGGELQPSDDADAAEWFEPAQLPELAFEATRHIFRHFYHIPG